MLLRMAFQGFQEMHAWSLCKVLCKFSAGSRDGAVARALDSYQCGLGSIPGLGVICGLSLLLVLVLAPQKPTFRNSNLILMVSPVSTLC